MKLWYEISVAKEISEMRQVWSTSLTRTYLINSFIVRCLQFFSRQVELVLKQIRNFDIDANPFSSWSIEDYFNRWDVKPVYFWCTEDYIYIDAILFASWNRRQHLHWRQSLLTLKHRRMHWQVRSLGILILKHRTLHWHWRHALLILKHKRLFWQLGRQSILILKQWINTDTDGWLSSSTFEPSWLSTWPANPRVM